MLKSYYEIKENGSLDSITSEKDDQHLEWEEARAHFSLNPEDIKFKKFIKIDGIIYSTHHPYIGFGGYKKVKLVKTEEDRSFALAIQQHKDEVEHDVLKKLNWHFGSVTTVSGEQKDFWKNTEIKDIFYTNEKHYLIMPFFGKNNLLKEIKQEAILPLYKTLQIEIKCAIALLNLHLKGILHRDIKPENFIIEINDDDIDLHLIDFNLSCFLEERDHCIGKKGLGTNYYKAFEVRKDGRYSFQSDIFALGKVFELMDNQSAKENTPPVLKAMINQMLAAQYEARPTLITVINTIATELVSLSKNNKSIVPFLKKCMQEIESFYPNKMNESTQKTSTQNKLS